MTLWNGCLAAPDGIAVERRVRWCYHEFRRRAAKEWADMGQTNESHDIEQQATEAREAAAIDAYLKSLRPVPSPQLVDGRLSPAAERGKKLFGSSRVGCYRCHPAPRYTDLKLHNVGTRRPYGFTDRFDTPTLIEVWRSAPYLHDGRYLTIKALITEGKHGKSRGRIEELSEQEIDDLVEFVLSL